MYIGCFAHCIMKSLDIATINVERFVGLDFCGFNPMEFSAKNFHGVLHLKYLKTPLYKACIL